MRHPAQTLLPLLLVAGTAALPGAAGAADTLLSDQTTLLRHTPVFPQDAGAAVGVAGDTAIVGTTFFFSPVPLPGIVTIYERDHGGPGAWGIVRSVSGSGVLNADRFASAVAIDGDVAVVGAFRDDDTGSAYLFARDEGGPDNWGELKKLTASDAAALDGFGGSVAIDGDTVVIGAGGSGVGGAAYVFQRDAGGVDNWGEVKKLVASDAASGDAFGTVALDGDTLIVGASGDDDGGNSSGSAYVFGRDEGGADNWGEMAKLTAPDAASSDRFGGAVAASGDLALIGATGVDASELFQGGAAYLYDRNTGGVDAWGEVRILRTSDSTNSVPESGLNFGIRVAIDGDLAVVSAPNDDERGTGAGAAYAFARNQGGPDNWGEIEKLTAADGAALDHFGNALDLSGRTAILGAPSKQVENQNLVGSAYIFDDDDLCTSGPSVCDDTWQKGSLLIRESKPGKEKFVAKLIKGPALSQTDLGTPLDFGGTAYTSCVFDDDDNLIAKLKVQRAAGDCAGKPCWVAISGLPPGGSGYRYRDKLIGADGVSRLSLRSGGVNKPRFQIQAKNNGAKGLSRLPTGLAAALVGSTSATLEVHVDDPPACHSVTVDQIKVSTSEVFKASN